MIITSSTARMRAAVIAVLTSALLQLGASEASAQNPMSTTTYTPSDAPIANPERGFYRHQGDCDKQDFVASTLAAYRTQGGATLVMCLFYLAEFKGSAISQAQLARFNRQAVAVRQAGLKMIVRFAYTKSSVGDDATPSRVQGHLDQLAPYLRANADVIAVVQSGFVGAWGEGYHSQNFGNKGVISAANWVDRKAVVDRLLAILPTSRKVQIRTPTMKTRMLGSAPATGANADAGNAVARVGHHHDCFLASNTDVGTYKDPAAEYPYLAADTKWVPMGGETCGAAPNPPRSDCPTALKELGLFHYSFLNRDWSPAVLNRWTAGGCMGEVDRRLGYRFVLKSVTAATTVTRGTSLPFSMTLRNDGWAAAFNPRLVRLVLRNTKTGAVSELSLTSARNWFGGTTYTLNQYALPIPSTLQPGTYALLLSLPDPSPALARRPEYAVRLANTGLWEPSTGFNRLLRTVEVR